MPAAIVPAQLEVLCDQNLVLTVSSPTVWATASGVAVRVTSEAPAGAYLRYPSGGDPMPASPTTWMLALEPGDSELSCATSGVEGEPVTVTVVDPEGHWSSATPEDYGCEMGGMPSWVEGLGGSGITPDKAIEALIDSFNDGSEEPSMTRAVHVDAGYPEGGSQVWIAGSETDVKITARVDAVGGSFEAWPDYLCVEGPWLTPDGA